MRRMSISSTAHPVTAIDPVTPVMLSVGLSTTPTGAVAAALDTTFKVTASGEMEFTAPFAVMVRVAVLLDDGIVPASDTDRMPLPDPEAGETCSHDAELETDHVMGRADAPNVIIDYFSLTCPHCANFHAAVLPLLKGEWIDNGKVRFVYRHFPSDAVATRASLLAECGGAKFFEAIDVLFKSQVDWMTAPNPEDELVRTMDRAGLSTGQCLTDGRLFDKVVGDVQSGQALGVKFTPTLFINEQKYGNPEGGILGIDAILRQVGR